MRFVSILALALFSSTALAQLNLWDHVPTQLSAAPRLTDAKLSAAQLKSITGVVRRWGAKRGCDDKDDLEELVDRLRIQTIPLSASQRVLLVGSVAGCAGNYMWVIRLDGSAAVTLASPEDQFGGWVYSIQPSVYDGYHDVVLGWHASSSEADLSYYRFDGNQYRRISSATGQTDQLGHVTIVPHRR